MLSMSIFFISLPFMTLGETERPQCYKHTLSDGAPPFSDLLTFDRFLHRAGLAKKQMKTSLDHPLFFEFIRTSALFFARYARHSALEHAKTQSEAANSGSTRRDWDEEVLAVTDMSMVCAHLGSTLGNVCPSTDLYSIHSYSLNLSPRYI